MRAAPLSGECLSQIVLRLVVLVELYERVIEQRHELVVHAGGEGVGVQRIPRADGGMQKVRSKDTGMIGIENRECLPP